MITSITKSKIALKAIDKNLLKRDFMTTESEAEPVKKLMKLDSKTGQFYTFI